MYWNLNYPVFPLHETLHSILCIPLSTLSTTNWMQSTSLHKKYASLLESCKVWSVGCRVLWNSGWIQFCRLFRELAWKFPQTTLNNTRITLLLHYCSFLLKIQLLYTYKCTCYVNINMQPHWIKTRVQINEVLVYY